MRIKNIAVRLTYINLMLDDYVYIDREYLFIKVMNTLSKFSTNIENELCI